MSQMANANHGRQRGDYQSIWKVPVGFSDLLSLSVMKRNNIAMVYSADRGSTRNLELGEYLQKCQKNQGLNSFFKC